VHFSLPDCGAVLGARRHLRWTSCRALDPRRSRSHSSRAQDGRRAPPSEVRPRYRGRPASQPVLAARIQRLLYFDPRLAGKRLRTAAGARRRRWQDGPSTTTRSLLRRSRAPSPADPPANESKHHEPEDNDPNRAEVADDVGHRWPDQVSPCPDHDRPEERRHRVGGQIGRPAHPIDARHPRSPTQAKQGDARGSEDREVPDLVARDGVSQAHAELFMDPRLPARTAPDPRTAAARVDFEGPPRGSPSLKQGYSGPSHDLPGGDLLGQLYRVPSGAAAVAHQWWGRRSSG
jgi:hypothetical protein